ncbi:MAG: Fpg/Nei family DNA glycosylase [Candidatus Sumerlaeota bacterium]
MPELPDVEVLKKYLDSTALHQQVNHVEVADARAISVTPRTLKRNLKGRKMKGSRRHGKFLMVELDNGRYLVLHFGMTGQLKYYKGHDEKFENERVRFFFDNGYTLAYVCSRMLGEVDMTSDPEKFLRERRMGQDAMDFSQEAFLELLEGRRGSIKSALMNQNIICGIGNVYSDEILYQAKVDPRTKIKQLGKRELKQIYKKMRYVLEKAVDFQADGRRAPRTWLLGNRDLGEKCPRCGEALKRVQINSRNAFMCPGCQD